MFDTIKKYTDLVKGVSALVKRATQAVENKDIADIVRVVGDLAYLVAPLLEQKALVGMAMPGLANLEADPDLLAAVVEMTDDINKLAEVVSKDSVRVALSREAADKPVKDIATVISIAALAVQIVKLIAEFRRKK